jgi:hypothetical protein
MTLNTENARKFNSSLKAAINELTSQKVNVQIINSHKFPNCYVSIYPEVTFSNEFRLDVFDAFGNKRENLLNTEDVCYGNIQERSITGKVNQWLNLFNK